MRTLILRWAVIVIAVFLVTWGLPRLGLVDEPIISYNDNWVTLALFAAILALLNTFIRPILVLLSLPLTCITLGLFSIVINALMFALAGTLLQGLGFDFYVASFWAALIGAIAVSIVGVVVNMVVRPD